MRSAYSIKIYRLGYYQGNGARLIDTIPAIADSRQERSPRAQPTQRQRSTTAAPGRCRRHGASRPSAVSGVYIARLIRSDTGGDSHIPFIVRNDGNTSQVLFQTSDTTWQAYNTYGGSDFYSGDDNGRAYKVSYNRPFNTRGNQNGRDFLFSNEYPMIRFLEQNGYDVSYVSGLDTSRRPEPTHQAQGLPVGRTRRVLVEGTARKRHGRPRRGREPRLLRRQRRLLEDAVGAFSGRNEHRPIGHWSASRTPGRTPRSTPSRRADPDLA